MTGIAEMVRSSLVAAVLVGGCSSTTTPQPCLTDSGSISPAMRWYGARLDEIHGKGTSCQAPVVVKGAYLPCERWSESGRCEYLTPLPMQLRWVLSFWVQTNYSRFR